MNDFVIVGAGSASLSRRQRGDIAFDGPHLVLDAGLLRPATLESHPESVRRNIKEHDQGASLRDLDPRERQWLLDQNGGKHR
jgi:hypothetical protein